MNTKPVFIEKKITRKFWFCGAEGCETLHQTMETAERCPLRNRKPLPDKTDRNEMIWYLIIFEGRTLKDVGKRYNLSTTSVRRVISNMARRKYRIRWYKSLDELRQIFSTLDEVDVVKSIYRSE